MDEHGIYNMSPTRPGMKLGEGIGPYTVEHPRGDVTIPELPGPVGIPVDRYLTGYEMAQISRHFEGIEFGLLRRVVKNSDGAVVKIEYKLVSGKIGEYGTINAMFSKKKWQLVWHTHPGEYLVESEITRKLLAAVARYASQEDLNFLNQFALRTQNRGSRIVVIDTYETFKYSINYGR